MWKTVPINFGAVDTQPHKEMKVSEEEPLLLYWEKVCFPVLFYFSAKKKKRCFWFSTPTCLKNPVSLHASCETKAHSKEMYWITSTQV